MGRAKNTIKTSEVSSTPVKFRYSVTYPSASLVDFGITVYTGSNIPYSVDMTQNKMESMNNYRVVRQLYYQQPISGSLLGSSSFWDPWWVSTAASGTYDATAYNFPTGSGQKILIFTIPSSQFGEQVARKTFYISSSGYRIADDGNGNLVDLASSNRRVGNIFYAQGIAVITDQNYITEDQYLNTEDSRIYETENNSQIILE